MKEDSKEDTGLSGSGPYRSPPQRDFVCFSEAARIVLECLEINSREGIFVGTLKSRTSSLAVIEALDTLGDMPCDVRLIGRVEAMSPPPTPMIRIAWSRAISFLPPDAFREVMAKRYGLLLDFDLSHLDLSAFPDGTEYDFGRKLVLPHTPDLARGDDGSNPRRQSSVGMRRYTEGSQKLRDTLGSDQTLMMSKEEFLKES
jgi:hypothetical protein